MAINTKLLRKIRKHILEEPRRYDQRTYGNQVSRRVSPCGTVACLAGWAIYLSGESLFSENGSFIVDSPRLRALELTGLINDAGGYDLFGDGDEWPAPYRQELLAASSKRAKAEVAARYLNRIIRTGKVT